ncbi:hypothetical protein BSY18_4045 (plasmid) [Blastomonas sp. RAC04]|uniref:DUF6961 family protein n=1 Tax=Blastomonas sp. RAC04 TaxID=1842535 RepID=UPI00083E6B95|nr:hypothetical protein [Blastomonas sp. RAC04]AOF98710.1 hypothetical protein BSY18_4045 [Blastomonas sp. RAC04]
MTDEQHLWACAFAVDKRYGAGAPLHVAERIGTLADGGDTDGVAMWQAIAVRLDRLRRGDAPSKDGIEERAVNWTLWVAVGAIRHPLALDHTVSSAFLRALLALAVNPIRGSPSRAAR